MKRFRVAENSMLPSLEPGEELVATDSREPAIDDLVVFPHPARRDFWLVKRRVDPPHALADDEAWVLSDNPSVTRADSRTLGPVPVSSMLTVVSRLDDVVFAEACAMLADEDDSLGRVLDEYGAPEFWRRPPGFATLVLLILEQQVSLESGAAVFRRLIEMAGNVSPVSIRSLPRGGMRDIGVTRQKAGYIEGLASALIDGRLDLEAAADAPPHLARDMLTGVKGIGPWTADAYLLSALGHTDVFPIGDRALQVGAAELLGMRAVPSPDELEVVAEPWRPVRAVAARIIWHAYLSRRGRSEPADPLLRAPLSDVRRVESP